MNKLFTIKAGTSSYQFITLAIAALFICSSCNRNPIPPPPAPAPSTTSTTIPDIKPDDDEKSDKAAQPNVAAAAPAIDFYDSRKEAAAFEKWKTFENRIRNAEFTSAENLLTDIKRSFERESDYRMFLDKAVPRDKQSRLTIMSVCDSCKGGTCAACEGSGKCTKCTNGVCVVCKGNPVRQLQCWSCICRTCSGSAKCRTCSGYGTMKCERCAGHGSLERRLESACRRCGGSGTIEGLRGPNGPTRVRCVTCVGRGKVTGTAMEPCTACAGAGRINCTACNGSGRCAACANAGRSASCQQCKGSGIIQYTCPRCNGSGKCDVCNGSAVCAQCRGSIRCTNCKAGLVRRFDFIIPADWLRSASGLVFFDTDINKPLISDPWSGNKTVTYKGHELQIRVEDSQFIWGSTSTDFEAARQAFKR